MGIGKGCPRCGRPYPVVAIGETRIYPIVAPTHHPEQLPLGYVQVGMLDTVETSG
jgi:hypothetical protein